MNKRLAVFVEGQRVRFVAGGSCNLELVGQVGTVKHVFDRKIGTTGLVRFDQPVVKNHHRVADIDPHMVMLWPDECEAVVDETGKQIWETSAL